MENYPLPPTGKKPKMASTRAEEKEDTLCQEILQFVHWQSTVTSGALYIMGNCVLSDGKNN